MFRSQVVTKEFISGPLQGLIIQETVAVGRKPWKVGDIVPNPIGASGYKIIAAAEPKDSDYHRVSYVGDVGVHG